MHIAHVQSGMSPEQGGPTNSLSNYCAHQVRAGHRVSVWTLEGYRNTSAAVRLPSPIENHVFPVFPAIQLGPSLTLSRALRRAESPDIYHMHGAWSLVMAYGNREAKRRKTPYVLEMMGMYESWCLRQKWLKKKIVRLWFQDRLLREAACLHVNSPQEGKDLSEQGFGRPIAVIPVGVDVEAISNAMARVTAVESWRDLAGRKFVLYFSRIHPKKGLDMLIHCWAELASRFPEWRLVIAGSGDEEYVRSCRELARSRGVEGSCIWTGHVDESQKTWLLSNAHCYVLPTHSENFGNTVAEALAHHTPVITTTQTPWSDLEPNRCGWQVPDTVAAICPALEAAMKLDEATRRQMGENGIGLVRASYSLESVTNSMLAVYRWVLGGGPKPGCVLF